MPREDDGQGRPLEIAPLACIPTTAGTGSEVSMAAVIKDPEEKVKIEIADFPLFPRLAILDPDTTKTLPPAIAAATGMDAMTHAIEGYVSTDWSPHQDALAAGAAHDPRQPRAGGRARRGGRGRARQHADRRESGDHDRARLGARDVAPGGRAVRRSARCGERDPPAMIRHNAQGGEEIADRYRDIGEIFDVAEPDIGEALAAYLTDLSERIGLPTRLSQVGVPEDGIPALVEGAMGDGTTLLNPREMGEDDYAELYRAM